MLNAKKIPSKVMTFFRYTIAIYHGSGHSQWVPKLSYVKGEKLKNHTLVQRSEEEHNFDVSRIHDAISQQ